MILLYLAILIVSLGHRGIDSVRTQIGIIYEITTGQIRRIVIPDEDHQLVAHAKVAFDEVLHIETQTGPIGIDEIKAIVRKRTGQIIS